MDMPTGEEDLVRAISVLGQKPAQEGRFCFVSGWEELGISCDDLIHADYPSRIRSRLIPERDKTATNDGFGLL